jgi:hypothetical protein
MRFFSGLILLILLTLGLAAQSPLSTVTGLATDPTGASVPAAVVRLVETRTGIEREAKSNATGNFVFPNLPPGDYKITAEAAGFQRLEVPEFRLDAFRTIRQDLRFALSSSATTLTVSAPVAEAIQTETPSVGNTLSSRQILELPTNLRSVYNNSGDSGLIANIMPLTVPGVVQMGSGAYWLTPGAGPNGMRLKVDGIDTNFGNFGTPDPVSQPSMESVQEFTANVVTNKAEFGGLGAVTTVTRAGTNQWHGDVFWFMRNSALDARNPFLTTRPFLNLHNYGVSAGGPVKKDRTFIFGTYDAYRGVRPYSFSSNVPTNAWRQGDFGSAAVRNPYDGNKPFPDNKIPASMIAPEATRAQDLLYPTPNFGSPTLTAGNYRAAYTGPEVHHILEGRIDHYFSAGHSVFARYQYKSDDYDIPGARSDLPPVTAGTSTNVRNMHFLSLGDTWSVTPTLFNEFRAGVVVLSSGSDADVKGQALLDEIGIKGLPPRAYAPGVPTFNVAGLSTYRQLLLNPVNDGHWQFSDNLTWVRGRHSFKFGGEMIRWFVNRYLNTNPALFGNFTFQNRFTGQSYGDFLLGLPTQVTRLDPFLAQYFRWNDFSLFAQDDYKVTSRLSLSFGLRYEYNQPAWARDDNFFNFDPSTGAVVVPSEQSRTLFSSAFPKTLPVLLADSLGLDRSLRIADTNNWAPRFGFSYSLDSAAKTVLRGGYGLYYGHYSVQALSGQVGGPFAVSTTSNNAFAAGQPLFTLANPFAVPGSSGTLNLSGLSSDLKHMYSHQWSLSLEREIMRDLGVRASYIGTKGTQLPYMRNINQPPASLTAFAQSRRPFTSYNNIVYAENGANNNYHGLQLAVTKRFARGLQFASTYSLAKQISEVDDTNNAEIYTQIEDAYDRRRDRADVYSVPRHQWMNNVLYELPLGKNIFLRGWQLNALVNLQSGHFLNPQFTGSDPSNTNTFGGRPDVLRAVDYPETLSAWYDRAAYGVPPKGRFGNAGRNTVEGPGFIVCNLGLNKTTQFEKLGSLQLGISFQNAFNHVNYGQPNMTTNVAQGGVITSTHVFLPAQTARAGQVTMRWRF